MVIEEVARERIAVVDEAAATDKPQNITRIVGARPEGREGAVIIDESQLAERVSIEALPRDRWLDHPLAVRQEGDAAIIPVVEEVVEKRLKLVEDVRVTKQQITKHEPQNVTSRRRNVLLERLPGPDDGKLN